MKKQNINIGDKLLCKISFLSNSTYIIKGKYYYIKYIDIINVARKDYYFYYLEDFESLVCCDEKELCCDEKEFCKYFYTKQEERKIKLEKLYEESKS